MSAKTMVHKLLHTAAIALIVGVSGNAQAGTLNISDNPLFLNGTVPPLNMIIMGRDHKLYYEAYNDASDLNNDGVLDTRYKGYELKSPAPSDPADSLYKIDYFGYFDSFKCYNYSGGVWDPVSAVGDRKTCPDPYWSGDWLNYVTTARIDAMRKVLYGGDRSTDTATDTILERTYVPQDAHSWGKDYTSVAFDGYDISEYTPLSLPTAGNRHFFANTTPRGTVALGSGVYAQAPLLRQFLNVEGGRRIWNWVSKERPVAHTSGTFMDGSGPLPTGLIDYTMRIRVCKAGLEEKNCKQYPNGKYKPTGLLQDYGEGAAPRMYFGLMTGSYAKNTSGGVLRRKIGTPAIPFSAPNSVVAPSATTTNEIDPDTGIFLTGGAHDGIITTFNRLHPTGFRPDPNFDYTCGWITTGPIGEGTCQMWGNPIAEIMFESERYFAGTTAALPDFRTTFGQGEESQLPGGGLPVETTWDDPYAASSHPSCAKPFETVISDINPTYDTDQLPGVDANFATATPFTNTDLPGLNVSSLGQTIWDNEFGGSKNIFIGQSGGTVDSAPTVKTATSFGNIRGLAPEDPTKLGGYYSASVAYYGHEHDLNPRTGSQKLSTFAVALASPLPKIQIPVNGRTVTLVPFAKSVNGAGIDRTSTFQPTNQIVDFYVDSLTATTGRFRVNYEDVEQGADHDMDAIVVYEYVVTGSTVTITLTSEYAAGGITQHMGYIISGTTNDGIFLEVLDQRTGDVSNDVDYRLDTPPTYSGTPRPAPATAAGWADNAPLPFITSRTFTAGTTAGAELLKNPLWYAAKWGGFKDQDNNGRPNLTAEWDENGDGDPDNYFLVTNALNLGQQLSNAFDEILSRVGSASSASVNAGSISSNTRVYQAKFNSGDWTGQLLSFPVQSVDDPLTTTVNEIGTLLPAEWEASAKLPAPTSRAIITTNANSGAAVAFRWTDIGATRQSQLQPLADSLGSQRLDFLRGDGSKEKLTGGKFRNRPSKLGDIVSSSPIFVGKPPFLYPDSLESVAYSTFVSSNASRQTMVYAGANDGMLHGFNAVTGAESIGFIPSEVFPNLVELTKPLYTHKFYVDGTPTVADAFFGSAWHTMLVGGLNKGGRSIYALDVTDPSTFSEANATSILKWEYTDADLGYTYSRPAIVRMANGKWAAVFGNGYNATNTGHAFLYVVDIQTGVIIKKIDTNVGTVATPNGLGTAALVDIDGDSIVDYAYAGDLQGNLWKFNLKSANPSSWDVAFVSGGVKSPLFVALDSGGARQPITSQPQVGRGPKGVGTIVLFGTGKFMELTDKSPTQTQTFYGVIDQNSGAATDIVSGRSVMTAQTIKVEQTFTFAIQPSGTVTIPLRVTTNNPVSGATGRGWYMDLLSPNVPVFRGEMQVSDSVLRNGRIIFTTLIPDADPCSAGGTSWLMEMDALSGSRLLDSPLDNNRDGQFTNSDFVTVNIDGTDVTVPVSGMQSEVGIAQRPGILSGETAEYKYLSGTTVNAGGSNIQIAVENPGPNARGRQSWRQVK